MLATFKCFYLHMATIKYSLFTKSTLMSQTAVHYVMSKKFTLKSNTAFDHHSDYILFGQIIISNIQLIMEIHKNTIKTLRNTRSIDLPYHVINIFQIQRVFFQFFYSLLLWYILFLDCGFSSKNVKVTMPSMFPVIVIYLFVLKQYQRPFI